MNLTKPIHPKIYKNCPPAQLGIDGAVFEKFWMNWFCQVSTFFKKRTLSIKNQTDSSFRRCSVTFEKSNSRSTLYFCVYLNYNLVSSIFRYLGGEGNWLGLGAPSRDPQGVGRLFWNPLCGNRWLIVPFFFLSLVLLGWVLKGIYAKRHIW